MNTLNEKMAILSNTKKAGICKENINATEQGLNMILPKEYKELCLLKNAPNFGEWQFFSIKDK